MLTSSQRCWSWSHAHLNDTDAPTDDDDDDDDLLFTRSDMSWRWQRPSQLTTGLLTPSHTDRQTSTHKYTQKLDGTHRVRTHAVLLLTLTITLTFDLSTQNHTTSRISESHYQVWTLWDHSFVSYAADKQTNKQTNGQTDSKILPRPTPWLTATTYGQLSPVSTTRVDGPS